MGKKRSQPMSQLTIVVMLLLAGILINNFIKGMRNKSANYIPDDVLKEESGSHLGLSWPTPLNAGEEEEVAKDLTRKNYYVIFDGSGSMGERKCSGNKTKEQVAKEALIGFSKKVSAKDNLGLLIFDSVGTRERTPLGVKNREQFEYAVMKSRANGSTPLKSAIRIGIRKLGVQARKQLGYGEYHMVIVTDGEASEAENPTGVVNYALGNTPIVVHTIGFCIGNDHSLNQEGRTFYRAANDKRSLNVGLGKVLAESEDFDVSDFKDL